MDASKLSNLDLEILDRVFCSFDQGEVTDDLGSPWDNEEVTKIVYDTYDQMRDDINQESCRRKLAASAKGIRYQVHEGK